MDFVGMVVLVRVVRGVFFYVFCYSVFLVWWDGKDIGEVIIWVEDGLVDNVCVCWNVVFYKFIWS